MKRKLLTKYVSITFIFCLLLKTLTLNAIFNLSIELPKILPQDFIGKRIVSSKRGISYKGSFETITIPYGEEEIIFSVNKDEPRILVLHKIPKGSHVVSLDGRLNTGTQVATGIHITTKNVIGLDPSKIAIRLPGGRKICPFLLPKCIKWSSYPRLDKANRQLIIGWGTENSGYIIFKNGETIHFKGPLYKQTFKTLNGSFSTNVEITMETHDDIVTNWLNEVLGYKKPS